MNLPTLFDDDTNEPSSEMTAITIPEAKTPEEENALQEYKGLPELSHLKGLLERGREIVVRDASESDLIVCAREIRITLKRARNAIENKRKALKENIVLRGKAIDGMANVFKAMIVPVENHLEEQERFAEIQEKKRLDELVASREVALLPYLNDPLNLTCYDLRNMTDQGFDQLLKSSKIAFEQQQEAERKAEEERKAKAEAERKEQERIKEEIAWLKKDQEAREKKLAEERIARQKAEAEAKAIKEAQERKDCEEKERQEAEEKSRKETEEWALRASDKVKLLKFAGLIANIEKPIVKSKSAQKTANVAYDRLQARVPLTDRPLI
jgi:hypothetical protein